MSRKTGRQFFMNPGPTNIPDSVLRAMDRPTMDFMDPEFMALFGECVTGLKRVLGTDGEVFLYTASGHGAWEATLTNLCSPGDTVLAIDRYGPAITGRACRDRRSRAPRATAGRHDLILGLA